MPRYDRDFRDASGYRIHWGRSNLLDSFEQDGRYVELLDLRVCALNELLADILYGHSPPEPRDVLRREAVDMRRAYEEMDTDGR